MKLNKVLALALSGVMAVSMLAGCSGNSGNGDQNGEGETPIVESGAAASVIAALDGDTTAKVDFSSSNSLQTTLETAIRYVGLDSSPNNAGAILAAMKKIDTNLPVDRYLPYVGLSTDTENTDKVAQSMMNVIALDTYIGADEAYAARQLAAMVDGQEVSYVNASSHTYTCADLLDNSRTYDDGENNGYWYDFDYSGDMAFASVTDAVTGQVTYVVAYTVTRTPTKTNK